MKLSRDGLIVTIIIAPIGLTLSVLLGHLIYEMFSTGEFMMIMLACMSLSLVWLVCGIYIQINFMEDNNEQ